jgi:medium-chain acyl-[acyl-carrier-protein] hydrolase
MMDSWIVTFRRTSNARVRLLCFPHAGGGPSAFAQWSRQLPSAVAVCALQAPGRERRLAEPPMSSLPALVQALAPVLRNYDDLPAAFFGHSLGSLVAFELTRELRRQGGPQPVRLLVSGCSAPHIPRRRPQLHQLSDAGLVRALRRLAGTSEEILDHPELMAMLLPILRADFAMSETYVYSAEPPLGCGISALGGRDDAEVTVDELAGWGAHTNGRFKLRLFDGDHFFLQQAPARVLNAVTMDLAESKLLD